MCKRPKLLIVDDRPNNLQLISELLSTDYKLYIANSGQNALKILDRVIPDLILLDIMMPEMSGYDVCEKLKQNPETKDIPVIFLTAKSSTDDVIKGFNLGAVDYISKPFNSREVKVRVDNHIKFKESQEALKQANKNLEKLNVEKDKFFSIISHDLKGSISGLVSLLGLLIKNQFTQEEKRKNALDIVYKSAQNTYSLLENLLTWSRLQVHSIKFNQSNIILNDILQQVKLTLLSSVTSKNIDLQIKIDANMQIFADINMIYSIFYNLLSNAIKFSNHNEKIEVFLSSEDKRFYTIAVKDYGIGMDVNTKNNLFKLENKTSSKGTDGETGTGLGLILCKEFINKHDGKIWIDSKIGNGSTFYLTLPKSLSSEQ